MSQPVPSSPPATPNADAGGAPPAPLPGWVGALVKPGFWVVLVLVTLGQALALYGAGVASRRIAAPELTWPVDLNFAQGPVGWLLVACLLIAGRRAARDAIAARVGLVLGLASLACYIVTWLWQRPAGVGWWTAWLGLGVVVHAFALYLIGLLALERTPARAEAQPLPASPASPPPPSGPAPIWQPGVASGRAWTRAGDAATGAGPSHVGQPDESGARKLRPAGQPAAPLTAPGEPTAVAGRMILPGGPVPSPGRPPGPGSRATPAARPIPSQTSNPTGSAPDGERSASQPSSPHRSAPDGERSASQPSSPHRSAPDWERSGSPWPQRDEDDPDTTLLRPPAGPRHPPTPTRP